MLDLETRIPQCGRRIPIEVASASNTRPQGRDNILKKGAPAALRTNMLEESQHATHAQDST